MTANSKSLIPNPSVKSLCNEFRKLGQKEQAIHAQRFFKTGKGEYGEGDVFLGIRVPVIREFAKKHSGTTPFEAAQLIKSPFHEERLLALILWVNRFKKGNEDEQKNLVKLYLENMKFINNWDLVDSSAASILGAYTFTRNKDLLYTLANSKKLWERRIAIIATHHFIAKNEYSLTLKLAEILLKDSEDLMHKAVGWMLREVGKRNKEVLADFLNQFCLKMPRTMLRYSIEKFPEKERMAYLKRS